MEFSHIENDTVYLHGTDEDKCDILILINAAENSFNTLTYAAIEPESIKQVKIENSDDNLVLSKGDLSVIFGILSAMESLGYHTEKLGVSKKKFVFLNKSIDEIYIAIFGPYEM